MSSNQWPLLNELFQAHTTVEVLDHSIALTSGVFQTLAVQDLDRAAQIFNETRAFQGTRGQAHAGTARAQHLSKELVSERKQSGVHAVLAHEKPAREALLNLMQTIARGQLCHLHAVHQGEAAKYSAKVGS